VFGGAPIEESLPARGNEIREEASFLAGIYKHRMSKHIDAGRNAGYSSRKTSCALIDAMIRKKTDDPRSFGPGSRASQGSRTQGESWTTMRRDSSRAHGCAALDLRAARAGGPSSSVMKQGLPLEHMVAPGAREGRGGELARS